jgi:hypothetical protein
MLVRQSNAQYRLLSVRLSGWQRPRAILMAPKVVVLTGNVSLSQSPGTFTGSLPQRQPALSETGETKSAMACLGPQAGQVNG